MNATCKNCGRPQFEHRYKTANCPDYVMNNGFTRWADSTFDEGQYIPPKSSIVTLTIAAKALKIKRPDLCEKVEELNIPTRHVKHKSRSSVMVDLDLVREALKAADYDEH